MPCWPSWRPCCPCLTRKVLRPCWQTIRRPTAIRAGRCAVAARANRARRRGGRRHRSGCFRRSLTEEGERIVVSGEISLRLAQAAAPAPNAPEGYLLLDGGNSQLRGTGHGRTAAKSVRIGRAPYRDSGKLGEEWRARRSDGISRIIGSAVCGEAEKSLGGGAIAAALIEWSASMPQRLGHTQPLPQPGRAWRRPLV